MSILYFEESALYYFQFFILLQYHFPTFKFPGIVLSVDILIGNLVTTSIFLKISKPGEIFLASYQSIAFLYVITSFECHLTDLRRKEFRSGLKSEIYLSIHVSRKSLSHEWIVSFSCGSKLEDFSSSFIRSFLHYCATGTNLHRCAEKSDVEISTCTYIIQDVSEAKVELLSQYICLLINSVCVSCLCVFDEVLFRRDFF